MSIANVQAAARPSRNGKFHSPMNRYSYMLCVLCALPSCTTPVSPYSDSPNIFSPTNYLLNLSDYLKKEDSGNIKLTPEIFLKLFQNRNTYCRKVGRKYQIVTLLEDTQATSKKNSILKLIVLFNEKLHFDSLIIKSIQTPLP